MTSIYKKNSKGQFVKIATKNQQKPRLSFIERLAIKFCLVSAVVLVVIIQQAHWQEAKEHKTDATMIAERNAALAALDDTKPVRLWKAAKPKQMSESERVRIIAEIWHLETPEALAQASLAMERLE